MDVNARVPSSLQTPLMYAVRNGTFKLARMLIENGADVQARDANGKTAEQIFMKYRKSYSMETRGKFEELLNINPTTK